MRTGREALDDLLVRIADLELFHGQEGVHERRLIAVILNRTGAPPIAAGTGPVRAYQDLLGCLDGGVHGKISMDDAVSLWSQCLAMLRQLFLPPDIRRDELDALASLASPSATDVTAVQQLIASPSHLRYFLARIASPAWLELLAGTGIIDPPGSREDWPAFAAVEHLAQEHADALAAWLAGIYDAWVGDVERVESIVVAAVNVGPAALPLAVRAVRDHRGSQAIAMLGVLAADRADASGQLVDDLADMLFNEGGWRALISSNTDGPRTSGTPSNSTRISCRRRARAARSRAGGSASIAAATI